MAVTLAESALLSQSDLQRGVVETFVQKSVVLDRIPLMDIQGNAYAYNEEAALPGVEFRAVNAAYAESTGTVNQKSEKLVILGGDADVDRFIVQTRGNLNDQRSVQEELKVKAASYKFQDTFINGDVGVDANSFDGLKKRLTGPQAIDAASAPIVGTPDQMHAFLDKLDELIDSVTGGADVLYMNRRTRGKIRSAARRIGGWTSTVNDFGRSVESYNGIALEDIGNRGDGSLIIPNNEGAGTNTTSIYAVHYGQNESDRAVTGLTNGGVMVEDLGELQLKPAYRTRIEFYCGMAVFGPGAARLFNVLGT